MRGLIPLTLPIFAGCLLVEDVAPDQPNPTDLTPDPPEVVDDAFVHSGTIQTESWEVGTHRLEGNLNVEGTLTVPPCSVIEVASSSDIRVRSGGSLVLIGTQECPITIRSDKTIGSPGDWGEIQIHDSAESRSTIFEYVIIEHGGGGNLGALWFERGTSAHLKNVTIRESGGYGLVVHRDVDLRVFENNTLIDNVSGPVEIGPDEVGQLGRGTYGPNILDGIVVRGGTLTRDALWANHHVPYVLQGTLTLETITGSAHLTVEAGTEIRVANGRDIIVRDNGGLTMIGNVEEPILVTSSKAAPGRGDWDEIEIHNSSSGGFNVFDHVIIEHGGGAGYGAVWVEGEAQLTMTNSIVRSSSDHGLYLARGAELVEFTGNTITDCAFEPVRAYPDGVGELGPGVYGPNDKDGILVWGGILTRDALWVDHGVPYILAYGIDIDTDSGSAALTVDAGVTILVGEGQDIRVEDNGSLTLDGTAEAPIIITSAKGAPAAGDWAEIEIDGGSVGPRNVFRFVEISFGGGDGFGQVWIDRDAELTLDNVFFDGAMECDLYLSGNAQVELVQTSASMCP